MILTLEAFVDLKTSKHIVQILATARSLFNTGQFKC